MLKVGLLCLQALPILAGCPFRRMADNEGGDADPEKLRALFARLAKSETVPGPEVEKRQGPFTTFDPAAQHISTTGIHAWAPPGPGDIRGPCPGLNALANHGYYPRSVCP